MRNLDVTLLRAFAVAADKGSMTAASRVLHLTQGAVSQQVARLEELTGTLLLTRGRGGVNLTASGERLLGKVRQMLALNDEIWSDVSGAAGGSVRLGIPYDLVGDVFAPVLKTYAQACPLVELVLSCGSSSELMRGLASGQLDLAVVEEPTGTATGEGLRVDRLVWAGAKNGVAWERTPLPLAITAETCVFRPAVLAALRGHDRPWRVSFENGSLDTTLARVRSDLAVSVWLASTVPADLTILPPDAGLPALPLFAITLQLPSRPASRAGTELAHHIRAGLARA